MMDLDPLEALTRATRRYRKTEQAHKEARQAAITAALNALRGGARPTDVADRSPFTAAYVRKLAREAGIEPARRGGGG